MMRWLISWLFWAVLAGPAAAQGWQAALSDDGAYVAAEVRYPGLAMSFSCHARSPLGGPVIDSMWFEATITPPFQFLVGFGDTLIPRGPASYADVILFAGQTGYRLPSVDWNEMVGDWETFVSINDAMFTGISGAQRLVLQVGPQRAWELPIEGLAPALAQARAHCEATWRGTAPAAQARPDAPGQNGFTVPPQVRIFAERRCEGPVIFEPSALQAGDLDGDGTPDVVLDWRGARCPGESLSSFCGAANCEINIFLSSRAYEQPVVWLAVGVDIVPHRSGRLGLRMGGTASVCHEIDCSVPWLWNGTELLQQP